MADESNTAPDNKLSIIAAAKTQAAADLAMQAQKQHRALLDNIRPAVDIAQQFKSLADGMRPAQEMIEQAKALAANTIEPRNAPAPILDTRAYEPSENYYQSLADIASYRYEEKYREQERLARLIAEEFIEQLEERNKTNFPEESRGRTPDFAYEWAYQQYKQGRERRHIWMDFVDIFLDDPTLSPDDLHDIKKAFNKAIDRRRKQEKLD